MSEFCEDDTVYASFFQSQVEPRAEEEEIRYIDWPTVTAPPCKECTLLRGADLEGNPPLRVIFAPLDLPGNKTLRRLFERYRIPAAFINERLHSVTYGSGSHIASDGFCSSWCHYLCKSIDVAPDPTLGSNSLQIVDPRRAYPFHTVDQSNWTWLRGGFFLCWAPSATPQQQNGPQSFPPGVSVTLICFGGPQSLIERFRGLTDHPEWQTMVQDPYGLFVIIFQEIFKQMDQQAWNLADVFRDIENTTLQKAAEINTSSTRYDFVGLYNIAKHCIYLKEGFDAVLKTLADINIQHQRAQLRIAPRERANIKSMLMHEQSLLESTNLRVASLNTRIQSIISLSFNLVNQQDSRVMWQDSQAMKAIAFITLLFLPMATVATFFGTPFFGLDTSTSPPNFSVSPQIWIFAATVVGLMVFMLPMWRIAQFGAEILTRPSVVPKRKWRGTGLSWGFVSRSTGNTNSVLG